MTALSPAGDPRLAREPRADPTGFDARKQAGHGSGWRDPLIYAALTAAVFVLYRDSFAVYFLNEDFTWLRHCGAGPLRALAALVRPDAETQVYSWRPLAQLWFGLNYAASGLDPFGYRLSILAWHAVATCTVYAIATQLLDRTGGVLAALVFTVHPAHVESLSWTCACGAVISGALGLLAVLTWLRWRTRKGPVWLVWLFFALSLLTQESSIVIPGLLAAGDLLLPGNRRNVAGRVQLYGGLAGVAVAFVALRHAVGPTTVNFGMVDLDPRWRLGTIDLLKFLVAKLGATSTVMLLLPPTAHRLAVALAAIITVTAVWQWRRGRPVPLCGLLWAGMAVAPYMLLLFGPFGRYLYLSLAGFGILLAALGLELYRRLRSGTPRLAPAALATLLMIWLAAAVHQTERGQGKFVRNGDITRTLLLDLLRQVPNALPGSTIAFHGMGDLRQRQGVFVFGLDDAVRLFYGDDSLKVAFPPRGPLSDDGYHLLYRDGRLERLRRQ